MIYLGYFILALGTALLFTPIFKKVARRYGIFARPNHRTIHRGQVPKLGGGSIFVAFISGILAMNWLQPELLSGTPHAILSLVTGAAILFFMGALDDKLDLNCNLKLFIEIGVALLAVLAGWRVETVLLPANVQFSLGAFSWPLSVLWIVGIANSFNMIDGLDGLAGGIALVVFGVSLVVAAMFGNLLIVVLSILMIGAVAGFLRYNINPASIFMGDSGSLSLGFVLACLSLKAAMLQSGQSAIVVPLLLLGLPITDTLLAVVRRLRRGIHPFHADKEHIHHRLVNLGLSQSGAAMFMIGITLMLGILAFLVAHGVYADFIWSHLVTF